MKEGRPALPPLAGAVATGGLAAAALLLAASRGAPYLSLDSVNPWLVAFAVCLFAMLGCLPFALDGALTASRPGRAESWEPAMMIWGGIAVLGAIGGYLLAAGAGWSLAESLAAAAGLVVMIETVPIALGVLVWVLGD